MKRSLLSIVGVATLLASVSAFAGPDWTVIERARAEARRQQTAQAQMQKQVQEAQRVLGSQGKAG
ncbi:MULTISPECIES: hypothetical protein [unclassified Cupriavidus]|uniref:hypothetical protein n=1 Tax=Cupriavidus sp. H19C3 TaxID=3241603 RepID=UPI0011DB8B7B|nr:MAG: hypothetical protein E6Q40_07930 [Cupriavidus sp.]